VIEGDQQTSVDADRIRATGAPAIQVNTGKGCHLDAPMVAEAFERLPLHGVAVAHGSGHAHPHPAAAAQGQDHAHPHDPAHEAHHHHHHAEKLLFIENVGNLVCPAEFNLGEDHKVSILSVAEGDDKPEKYPLMFHLSSVMLLNKTDLLPYVDFSLDAASAHARKLNKDIAIFPVACRTGEGLAAWYDWLRTARAAKKAAE